MQVSESLVKKSISEIAERFLQFMNDGNGKFLESVRIKGDGYGFYYSASSKSSFLFPETEFFTLFLIENRTKWAELWFLCPMESSLVKLLW